ncbi:unnamed protein product [Leptidea sinapis]|uniref:Multivesicular body subunit 12A n=1 Tax=Leptidea sinapis TaxID=189913 RepID=A0A5E4Q3Y4_9NEOP|nr:unnamed protein product [Leptidea sinapis]
MSKVLSALGGALPDERPILSLQIVESAAKCPAGYWPVSRTYDEDADAGLLRQAGLFGKKPSHYICLSKSEGVPGYVMDGVMILGEREATPAGYSVAGRAGKRRLCTRVSRLVAGVPAPPVTDVIVCSRMKTAPQGFLLAGYVGPHCRGPTPYSHRCLREHSVNSNQTHLPDRPPKLSPLVNELNGLNLKSAYPNIEEFTTDHDYEALSPSYNIKPGRPAPRPPVSPLKAGPTSPQKAPRKKGPAPLPRVPNYQTLGGYSGMEGVPFVLNPKLRGLPSDALGQMPVIKKRSRFDLDRDHSYTFAVERQT